MASDGCLFCRIAAGDVPVSKLHSDEICIAVADIAPQAPVHLLILPREHLVSTVALDGSREALAGHLLRVAAELARERGLDATGYRLVLNHGVDAGQTVPHLHLHLLGGRVLGALG
ncbi:MAG: histidine triad nucleotide-binding protein [bacterium]